MVGHARPFCIAPSQGARVVGKMECLPRRERPVAIAAGDGEHLAFGAALRMHIERPAIRDLQALGRDGLDPNVVGAGSDGALDPGTSSSTSSLNLCPPTSGRKVSKNFPRLNAIFSLG